MNRRLQRLKSMSSRVTAIKMQRIAQAFNHIPVVSGKGGYHYSFFTLTDYHPAMAPDLIEDMADLIVSSGHFEYVQMLVSEADRGGGPLTHAVAVRTGLPYTLANWYPKETPGEVVVKTATGFSGDGIICVNGLIKNQKVTIVDELLSTGGTILALLEAIEKSGSVPVEVICVAEKLGFGGREKIAKKYPLPITTLVKFVVNDTRTEVIEDSK